MDLIDASSKSCAHERRTLRRRRFFRFFFILGWLLYAREVGNFDLSLGGWTTSDLTSLLRVQVLDSAPPVYSAIPRDAHGIDLIDNTQSRLGSKFILSARDSLARRLDPSFDVLRIQFDSLNLNGSLETPFYRNAHYELRARVVVARRTPEALDEQIVIVNMGGTIGGAGFIGSGALEELAGRHLGGMMATHVVDAVKPNG